MHAMFNKEKINRWTVNDIAGVTNRRHEEENILQKQNLNDTLDITCSVESNDYATQIKIIRRHSNN